MNLAAMAHAQHVLTLPVLTTLWAVNAADALGRNLMMSKYEPWVMGYYDQVQ